MANVPATMFKQLAGPNEIASARGPLVACVVDLINSVATAELVATASPGAG